MNNFTPEQQDELTQLVIVHSGARIGEFLADMANGLAYEEMAQRRETDTDNVKSWFINWNDAINGRIPPAPSQQILAALMVRYVYDRTLMSPELYSAATSYLQQLHQVNPEVKLDRAYGKGHGVERHYETEDKSDACPQCHLIHPRGDCPW